MTEIQRILLTNIKKYRSRRKYTQMKLAELCDVSPSYIGEIEIGRKYPSAKTLEKIALERKMPIEDFIVNRIDRWIDEYLSGRES